MVPLPLGPPFFSSRRKPNCCLVPLYLKFGLTPDRSARVSTTVDPFTSSNAMSEHSANTSEGNGSQAEQHGDRAPQDPKAMKRPLRYRGFYKDSRLAEIIETALSMVASDVPLPNERGAPEKWEHIARQLESMSVQKQDVEFIGITGRTLKAMVERQLQEYAGKAKVAGSASEMGEPQTRMDHFLSIIHEAHSTGRSRPASIDPNRHPAQDKAQEPASKWQRTLTGKEPGHTYEGSRMDMGSENCSDDETESIRSTTSSTSTTASSNPASAVTTSNPISAATFFKIACTASASNLTSAAPMLRTVLASTFTATPAGTSNTNSITNVSNTASAENISNRVPINVPNTTSTIHSGDATLNLSDTRLCQAVMQDNARRMEQQEQQIQNLQSQVGQLLLQNTRMASNMSALLSNVERLTQDVAGIKAGQLATLDNSHTGFRGVQEAIQVLTNIMRQQHNETLAIAKRPYPDYH
ncbi:hypothetical protein BC939DRAFT_449159 [Gamsiella multidivaricata]|uniref:uncharacterized protein n=1 Tax=Gamsiella multidivaricata TaxID=101098 RepID=UPI0022206592|nr:uncharacterized protein BC939DRAFT_449159 [Gamsiella multidivaricata]KAI7824752.1 hypothetical protein BC939DRAFT_449159 [Gamsiella multidivaricata]